MTRVLTQKEIDSLLTEIGSSNEEEDLSSSIKGDIKEYDFARPSKFSKEHLRTLEIIFEHYVRNLSTQLPAYFRKSVQIEVEHSEAMTYSEFTKALSNPVLLGIVNFTPLKGNIVIELASKLGFTIVDLMLGGVGRPMDKLRDFSEIELNIIERIFQVFVEQLKEPWQNVVDISPHLERIETNRSFAQFIASTEIVAVVTINLKIGNIEGLMNFCLPFICLEAVMDKLNTKYWFSVLHEREEGVYHEVIESIIEKAQVPLKTVLGKSSITVNDFANLQAGDIIKTGSKTDEELEIYVGNILKFVGLPGASSEMYAMKVTSVIREE